MLSYTLLALQRQKDPHWKAFYFRADHSVPTTERQESVKNIFNQFVLDANDNRMSTVFFPEQWGSLTLLKQLDLLLEQVILRDATCQWVSIMSGSTVLGSNVVHDIRHQSLDDEDVLQPDILLLPGDNYYQATQSE